MEVHPTELFLKVVLVVDDPRAATDLRLGREPFAPFAGCRALSRRRADGEQGKLAPAPALSVGHLWWTRLCNAAPGLVPLSFVLLCPMTLSFVPRIVQRQPAFAAAGIGVIAMGVALAATAASLINALLFRPLPTHDGDQLYRIDSGLYSGEATAPDTRDLIEALAPLPVFSFSTWTNTEYRRGSSGGTELVDVGEVQGGPFGVLGWHPAQGRLLTPADHLPGSEPVAVLSHAFWQRELGGEAVLDEIVTLNGVPFRIVGVLPPGLDRMKRTRVPGVRARGPAVALRQPQLSHRNRRGAHRRSRGAAAVADPVDGVERSPADGLPG